MRLYNFDYLCANALYKTVINSEINKNTLIKQHLNTNK